MIFFTLLISLSTAIGTVGLPAGDKTKDVISPHITSPQAGDSYTAGQTITVTWDTSNVPDGSTVTGEIVLGFLTADSENLDTANPLATDFLLADGYHDVTFPYDLPSRDNYIIGIFGDSGNISGEFTIYGLN